MPKIFVRDNKLFVKLSAVDAFLSLEFKDFEIPLGAIRDVEVRPEDALDTDRGPAASFNFNLKRHGARICASFKRPSGLLFVNIHDDPKKTIAINLRFNGYSRMILQVPDERTPEGVGAEIMSALQEWKKKLASKASSDGADDDDEAPRDSDLPLLDSSDLLSLGMGRTRSRSYGDLVAEVRRQKVQGRPIDENLPSPIKELDLPIRSAGRVSEGLRESIGRESVGRESIGRESVGRESVGRVGGEARETTVASMSRTSSRNALLMSRSGRRSSSVDTRFIPDFFEMLTTAGSDMATQAELAVSRLQHSLTPRDNRSKPKLMVQIKSGVGANEQTAFLGQDAPSPDAAAGAKNSPREAPKQSAKVSKNFDSGASSSGGGSLKTAGEEEESPGGKTWTERIGLGRKEYKRIDL